MFLRGCTLAPAKLMGMRRPTSRLRKPFRFARMAASITDRRNKPPSTVSDTQNAPVSGESASARFRRLSCFASRWQAPVVSIGNCWFRTDRSLFPARSLLPLNLFVRQRFFRSRSLADHRSWLDRLEACPTVVPPRLDLMRLLFACAQDKWTADLMRPAACGAIGQRSDQTRSVVPARWGSFSKTTHSGSCSIGRGLPSQWGS